MSIPNINTQPSPYFIADRQIRGVAFNFEGTCVDVEAAHWSAHLKILEIATGIDIVLNEENWPRILELIPNFIGGPREQVIEDIYRLQFTQKRKVILPREELSNQDNLFYKLYLEKIEINLRPGLREWVDYLRTVCLLPVAMGTTTEKDEAEYIISKCGLNTVFPPSQIVFGKNRDLEGKPKPDIYLATAQLMGINPIHQLVMGDSFTSDALAAAAAGSVFVAMPTVDRIELRFKFYGAGAVALFPGWNDVGLFGFQEFLHSGNKSRINITPGINPAENLFQRDDPDR